MKSNGRRLVGGLAAAAMLAAVPLPATAAPWGSALADVLPDADLFCPGADDDPVNDFVGQPAAAVLWIEDDDVGGHYVIEASTHYLAFELLHEPISDLESSGLTPLGSVTYGQREGLDHAMTCQVVSRWVDPEDPTLGVTVFADVALAGPVGG